MVEPQPADRLAELAERRRTFLVVEPDHLEVTVHGALRLKVTLAEVGLGAD